MDRERLLWNLAAVVVGFLSGAVLASLLTARDWDPLELAAIGLALVIAGRFLAGFQRSRSSRRWLRPIDEPDRPVPVIVTGFSPAPPRQQVVLGGSVSGFGLGLMFAWSPFLTGVMAATTVVLAAADASRAR